MKKKQFFSKQGKTSESTGGAFRFEPNRREFLAGLTGTGILTALNGTMAVGQSPQGALNIARVAIPSSFTLTSENKISALNDGFTPSNSFDRSHGVFALPRESSTSGSEPWVQYEWSEP